MFKTKTMRMTTRSSTLAALVTVAFMYVAPAAFAFCAAPGGGDYCGGPSPNGCFCDSLCTSYGDCCSDYDAVCVNVTPPPPVDLECDTQSKKRTLPPYGALEYEVKCAPGFDVSTGGSAWAENGAAQSQSRAQGNAWRCGFYNSGSFSVDVTCSVKCCRTK